MGKRNVAYRQTFVRLYADERMPIARRINSCTQRTYFIQMESLLLTFESLKFYRPSKDKNVFVNKRRG